MAMKEFVENQASRGNNATSERENGGNLGVQMHYDLERKELILEAYEQAILLAPFAGELYYRKGQILEQLGRLAEAKRSYNQADRLDQ